MPLPQTTPAHALRSQSFSIAACAVLLVSIPDAFADDCNHNGISDNVEIASGAVQDCNHNGIPDECELRPTFALQAQEMFHLGRDANLCALADFTGDGLPDILIKGQALVRNLGGRFASPVQVIDPFFLDGDIRAVAAADINGDGRVDMLAGAHRNGFTSGRLYVALGNGDGTFGPVTFSPIENNVFEMVVADFDSDGDLDVVLTHNSIGRLTVVFNNGAGVFSGTSALSLGSAGYMALGDFDGDGHPDIAVTSSSAVKTYRIQSGALQLMYTLPGPPGGSVVAADLDGDGDTDLAYSAAGSPSPILARNNGGGNFTLSNLPSTGIDNPHMIAVDFDGDGRPDLCSAGTNINSTFAGFSALRSLGGGSFAPAVLCGYSSLDVAPLVADFDGDGVKEAVVMGTGTQSLELIENMGGAPVHPIRQLDAQTAMPATIVAADFDLDGRDDLVVGSRGVSSQLMSFRNTGTLTFFRTPIASFAGALDFIAANIDTDADTDLIVTTPTALQVYRNVGGLVFSPGAAITYSNPAPGAMCAADLDGDGDNDIALGTSTTAVDILRNSGIGNFTRVGTLGSVVTLGTNCLAIVAGDIDGDGDKDLVSVTTGGVQPGLTIIRNLGAMTFGAPVHIAFGSNPPARSGLVLYDLDGDGDLDLITTQGVFLNNGTGTFTFSSALGVIGVNPIPRLADLDGDGRVDLYGITSTPDAVFFRRGRPVGFDPALYFAVGSNAKGIALARLDADARPDIAVACESGTFVSLLVNASTPPSATDANGNGIPDDCDVPPCPPDFNHDLTLNPDDIGDYITCFFTEPPCAGADYNQDSMVNPDDLGDFITAFFLGC